MYHVHLALLCGQDMLPGLSLGRKGGDPRFFSTSSNCYGYGISASCSLLSVPFR